MCEVVYHPQVESEVIRAAIYYEHQCEGLVAPGASRGATPGRMADEHLVRGS